MNARLYILKQLDDECRQMALDHELGSPSWGDGQFVRACTLRLQRGEASAWADFQQRIDSNRDFALAVRLILIERLVVRELFDTETEEIRLFLVTKNVVPLSFKDEKRFLNSLNVWERDQVIYATSLAHWFPDSSCAYQTEDRKAFLPPSKQSNGEIRYIEMKPGLRGPARIGRVTFSKTRKTIYYHGKKLQTLSGSGYKANYFDIRSGMWYWVSGCRKDGNDALYPATVEIDDDVREQYWTEIRQQPENKHLTKFRSPGKYSRRKPC